jgi:hypothetical protein
MVARILVVEAGLQRVPPTTPGKASKKHMHAGVAGQVVDIAWSLPRSIPSLGPS